MGALRAILVDDEMLAIRRLTRCLEQVEGVEIVASTTSARQAVDLIGREVPDIVFLDIAMPGLSGFEVIENIGPAAAPAIIFVTAYDEHAVQAFDVEAADYLLKPFAQSRLEEAVDRGRRWLKGRSGASAAASGTSAEPALDSLWVHRHREFIRIPLGEVEWIEGYGDYAKIHGLRTGGLARMTLTSLEEKLDSRQFIRVHRSAICRKAAIVSLGRKATGAMSVLLTNGDTVPVGRTFVPGLRALLKTIQS